VILKETPPTPACSSPPSIRTSVCRIPKVRLLIDFMADRCQRMIGKMLE
jgi:hypothetical protein